MSNHFIVYHRAAAWQFTHKGRIAAPFYSREEAIASAIEAARETGQLDAEVVVQDPDVSEHMVWSGVDNLRPLR